MINEEAIKNLKKLRSFHNGSYGSAIDKAIEMLKEEKPQGEWIWLGDNPNPNHKWSCDKCGRGVKEQENFCPNCGAMMQKEDAEND